MAACRLGAKIGGAVFQQSPGDLCMILEKLKRLFNRGCRVPSQAPEPAILPLEPVILAREPQSICFAGAYATWAAAAQDATGYNAPIILERTRAAMLKVKSGEAIFERDSVIFDQPEWPWPVLACLLKIAIGNGGRLSVLDFGGALGSTYFTCRRFFQSDVEMRWSVIEQPSYVACGRREFQDEQVRFYGTIDECLAHEQPQVLLISGTLQFLEDPWGLLAMLASKPIGYLLIDRTTVFRDSTPDRLTVQTVPESIYPASYPCWMLSYPRLKQILAQAYEVVAEFPAHEGATMPFDDGTCGVYAGLFLKRKVANFTETEQ